MSKRSVAAELRDAARQVKKQGWTIETDGSNHQKWISPEGRIVTVPSTPSDPRSVMNTISDLRRNGAVINGRAGSVISAPVQRRQTDSLPQIEQRRPIRARHRERPRNQRQPVVPGFEFPEFEMPAASWSPDSKAEEARQRRWQQKTEEWAERRICDGCCRRTGPDTLLVLLSGSMENRRKWFLSLPMPPGDEELDRLMRLRCLEDEQQTSTAQLCVPCARRLGIAEAGHVPYVTFGDVLAAYFSGDTSSVVVAAIDVDSQIPPAFQRKGLPPGAMSRKPYVRMIGDS